MCTVKRHVESGTVARGNRVFNHIVSKICANAGKYARVTQRDIVVFQ